MTKGRMKQIFDLLSTLQIASDLNANVKMGVLNNLIAMRAEVSALNQLEFDIVTAWKTSTGYNNELAKENALYRETQGNEFMSFLESNSTWQDANNATSEYVPTPILIAELEHSTSYDVMTIVNLPEIFMKTLPTP